MVATPKHGEPGRPSAGTASRVLLLTALAAGAAAQGGYFTAGRAVVGVLLVAAVAAALLRLPPSVADLRSAVVLAAVALAGWALLQGVVRGVPASGMQYGLLLAAVVGVLLVCRRLDPSERELLLAGVVAVGVVVAATGWAGVVLRLRPLALPDQGLWRAASVLTYANATAALLVPLALVALGLLIAQPASVARALVATALLVGAGATLSRAGAVALLVGLLLLGVLSGLRRLLRAAVGPAVGALVALAGLLPAMPASAPADPMLAAAALASGMGLAALLSRPPVRLLGRLDWARRGRAWVAPFVVAALLVVGAGALTLAGGRAPATVSEAVSQVAAVRLTLSSADRAGATGSAVRLLAASPLTGVGPGQAALHWTGAYGELRVQRYVHNEYLQVMTELGVIGGLLLAWLLGAIARLAWRGRQMAPSPAAWIGVFAGLAALAVHSAFDFIWHIPVIPLTATVLVAVLITPVWPAAHGCAVSHGSEGE